MLVCAWASIPEEWLFLLQNELIDSILRLKHSLYLSIYLFTKYLTCVGDKQMLHAYDFKC